MSAHVIEMRANIVALDTAIFALPVTHDGFDHHAVARSDVRHPFSHFGHHACQFMPHNVAFELLVVLLPVAQIGAADSGDVDTYLDPLGAGK